MPGITGRGTTYNLPNFVGDLFAVTPTDTPFLSAVGGLTGGEDCSSVVFQWQGFDLRDAGQNTHLEGQDAPAAQSRVRFNVDNITQIHHETVDISYTKLAATGLYSGNNIAGNNPVLNESQWQLEQMLKQVARDIEWSFLNGTYHKPSNNTTARRTRGILQAIETNVVANATPTALSEKMVLDLMQRVWDNGGIQESETATLIVNSIQKRKLTEIFIKSGNYRELSRNVGGVNVQTIETDFGKVNIMLNRYMPNDQLLVTSLEQCAPVFVEIPGKGHLFIEPLAKTGASERSQVYCEVGLKYGNEKTHGKITNLTVV